MKNKKLVEYNIKLLKIELFLFSFFILITFIFNIYTQAHKHFNKSDLTLNFHGIFALLTTYCYGLFFWICICFPVLWLTQLIVLIKERYLKKYSKHFLLVTILYLISLFAWFSLYSIEQHQSTLERRQDNMGSYKNNCNGLYLGESYKTMDYFT